MQSTTSQKILPPLTAREMPTATLHLLRHLAHGARLSLEPGEDWCRLSYPNGVEACLNSLSVEVPGALEVIRRIRGSPSDWEITERGREVLKRCRRRLRGMHPEWEVQDRSGRRVMVDVWLAPTLQMLWSAGIETLFSCQGDADLGTYAHITFPDLDQGGRFIRCVLAGCERANPALSWVAKGDGAWRPMHQRASRYHSLEPGADGGWVYRVEFLSGEYTTPRFSISFPHQDILAIQEAVRLTLSTPGA